MLPNSCSKLYIIRNMHKFVKKNNTNEILFARILSNIVKFIFIVVEHKNTLINYISIYFDSKDKGILPFSMSITHQVQV